MDTKNAKKNAGALKKLVASIKKAVAKEFLSVLLIMAISIPLALALQYIISADAQLLEAERIKDLEEITAILTPNQPPFRVLYALCVAGIYFSRLVTGALKTQLGSKS